MAREIAGNRLDAAAQAIIFLNLKFFSVGD
jgi:hypothetical protein